MIDSGSVLIVGGNMYLGQLLRRSLDRRFSRVRSLDSQPMTPLRDGEELVVGDIGDPDFLSDAMAGFDIVVDVSKLDLARCGGGDPATSALGAFGLWEGARLAGVRRVVVLVSDGVVGFYRRSATLDHLTPSRPDSPIGLIGTVQEAAASLYAYKFGLQAMAIRMGSCRPQPLDERMLSTWISPSDFCRLIEMALTADYLFEIVYGVSANADRWWDNANARRLGYVPRDRSDRFGAALRGRRSANAVENAFQGGAAAASDFAGDIRRIP